MSKANSKSVESKVKISIPGVGMYYLGFGNGQEKAISRPNIFQMLQDEISAEQIDISLK